MRDRAAVRNLILALLLAVLSAAAQTKAKPSAPESPQTVFLRRIVSSGRLDDLHWPNFYDYRAHVDAFYRAGGYALVWTSHARPTPRTLQIITLLKEADREGLRAEDYDGPQWSDRAARFDSDATPDEAVRFDVALTVCLMRYVSDVRIGRINPQHFKFGFDVGRKKLDLPQFLRLLLVPATDVPAEIVKIEPPIAGYKRARGALLHYIDLENQGPLEPLPSPPGMTFPGGPYDGVAQLAKFLQLVGDLPKDALLPADNKTYDEPLVSAVKRFQDRHGLPVDGFLTRETVEQMNVPLSARIEQIRMTLERYRWLHYDFPQPPIAVNVPEFRLYAFDRGAKLAFVMNVNVGDSYDFQTPIFESSIRYLVFRPYWNVPPRILRDEVIPDIESDRKYVEDSRMEVVSNGGQVVTDGMVGDDVLRQLKQGKLQVRQKPGSDNALGLLKVIFPNEHSVYLHDTPEGVDMFSETQRAFSHGCIHLQDPGELAAWLLRDKPGWSLERVQQAMHEGRDNITVTLTKPVPILLVYSTVVVREDGTIHFYRDIYGLDKELEDALAKGYPYPG